MILQLEQRLIGSERKFCVYLFVASLAIHLVYLSQYARAPFFWVPELDPLLHDQLARQIAAGHGVSGAFFRAPLYYYALGGVYRLLGHSYWIARIIQACIGSASCVLAYRLGRNVFRPIVGGLAAILMALYGPLVFADGELHTPVLEVFFDLALLLASHAAWKRPGWRRWLLVGLILGLSAIVRPNILVALLPALWLISRTSSAVRTRAALCAALLAGSLLLPGLVTLRNDAVARDPVFIASQGGINFYLGNRPGADGYNPSTPTRYDVFGADYVDSVALYGQKAAEKAMGRPLTQSEAQSYWYRQSFAWWRSDPRAAISLTWKKFVIAWSHQEVRNNLAYDYVRREWASSLWGTFAGFWLAGPLGLIGMALAWRRGAFEQFLILFTGLYFASYIVFFAADRYRLPMVPVLLIFGAYAIVWMWERISLRQTRALAPALAVLLIAGVFVNVDWYRTVTPATWAQDYWSAGLRYVAQHKYTEADAQVQRALTLDPRNPEIWGTLGEIRYNLRDFRDAGAAFTQAAALDTTNASYAYDLALCAEQLGNRADALRDLQLAVALRPDYTVARNELAIVRRS